MVQQARRAEDGDGGEGQRRLQQIANFVSLLQGAEKAERRGLIHEAIHQIDGGLTPTVVDEHREVPREVMPDQFTKDVVKMLRHQVKFGGKIEMGADTIGLLIRAIELKWDVDA